MGKDAKTMISADGNIKGRCHRHPPSPILYRLPDAPTGGTPTKVAVVRQAPCRPRSEALRQVVSKRNVWSSGNLVFIVAFVSH